VGAKRVPTFDGIFRPRLMRDGVFVLASPLQTTQTTLVALSILNPLFQAPLHRTVLDGVNNQQSSFFH